MRSELSPAAQAIINAMYEINMNSNYDNTSLAIVTLRAVADHVAPQCSTRTNRGVQQMSTRIKLHAIAAELASSNV
jgi:hypothetical protein